MVITLTQGQLCIVDEQDWPLVKDMKWCAWTPNDGMTFYASTGYRAGPNKWRTKLMHHILIPVVPPGFVRDHENGIGTDNRRSNLRVCTRKQNNRNRRGNPGTSSQYRGVTWHKAAGKWSAQIKCDGRYYHLGLHESEIDAAVAYDRKSVELFGEYAKPNFHMGACV